MLSESLLARLRGLTLSTARRRRGTTAGERRSPRRGRSIEFADYRAYSPGDDPRRIDWNVFARHERAVVKLFEEEEDLAVHILVDQSASMFPQADDARTGAKFDCAAELALLLGYVALAAGDALSVQFSTGRTFGPRHGLPAFADLTRFIDDARAAAPNARLNLAGWLAAYAQRARPGLCLLLSDFLDESRWQAGVTALGAAGLEVAALHVLSPDELDPSLSGDLRLTDVETGDAQEISVDESLLAAYQRRLQEWTAEVAAGCRRSGGRWLLVDSSQSPERIALHELRKAGWLA
jgi:uncharacterized protein (DUF58 family)